MLEHHPEALIVGVGVAVLAIAVAVGWALDVFLEHAEREEPAPPRPANSAALDAAEREQLMAAHSRVVARHAAELGARVRVGSTR